jgi:hypothetical protein
MKKPKLLYSCLAMILIAFALLAGCGGSASDTAATSEESGEVVVSLTDAPGDFANYTVDVLSLTLTKANGALVSTLPLQTRVDFSQYTDMTEFLTAATVPNGVYVAATMTLDYRHADIWVEDENGQPAQAGTVVDANGDPVQTLEVTVQLEDRNRLVIAPGVPAHLMLDFNLAATNQVDWGHPQAPGVTVDPMLVAQVNRNENKPHRLRGLLNSVSVQDSSFSIYLRPFYCLLTGSQAPFGVRTVTTTATTAYMINGVSYTGEDGLTAMAGLDALTPVMAIGDLMFDPLRFEARQVYAGSCVPGGTLDAVQGSVLSRTGDTLTVLGATLIRADGTVIFHDRVTVLLGEETTVTRQYSDLSYNIDDISVGQRVRIFGQVDESAGLSLDATQGYVQMLLTAVRGDVTGVAAEDPTAQLTLAVQSINQHRVAEYDFSGTGVDAAHDADPDDYEIDTGTIDLGSLVLDTPVKVRGFVQPFGQAPADFSAQTIISVADVPAYLKVHWTPPSDTPFESISDLGLVLDLDGAGAFHHLIRSWVVTNLVTDVDQAVTVVPREEGTGLFVIRDHGVVRVGLVFADFIEALQGYLQDGAVVHDLGAVGRFDDATATLTADTIDVQLR